MGKIIVKVKKFIDNIYYKDYYENREILIREIFPGVNHVGEFKYLDLFLKNHNTTDIENLVKVIGDFYWGEVSRLSLEGKFSSIERNQGLLDFAQSLKDYNIMLLREAEDKTL